MLGWYGADVKRTTCSACGYDGLELFLDLGRSPLADAYQDHPDATPPTYPLQLAVCTGCWLVQLLEVVPGAELFESGYSFYSSASAPLSAYHEAYADDVLAQHGELAKRLVVEVGCNDGDFLRHFVTAGCPVVGVDPAEGPACKAVERGNLPVLIQSFDAAAADRIYDEHGAAGVVVANHVLAHVESVSDVLEGVALLLAEDGVAFVEVQYLPDLLVNNAFDLVYHEHRNFFSLSSLESAAERWGLRVVDARLTDRQGGSLRVELVHARTGAVPRPSRDALVARERWLRDACAYRGFQGRVDRIADRLRELVYEHGGRCVGYGAPAKATTLLNFCRLDSDVVSVITDTTPAKQYKYVPGVGALIVPPSEVDFNLVDLVLVLSWNYAPQILRQHPEFRGRWLVPIPAPVVL